jgi:hypothetical protein
MLYFQRAKIRQKAEIPPFRPQKTRRRPQNMQNTDAIFHFPTENYSYPKLIA